MRHLTLVATLASIAMLTACATRTATQRVIHRYGLDIQLRSEKPLFGAPVAKGYDHPAIVSPPRLETILRGIQIDTRSSEKSAIRERRSAIRPEIVERVAQGLSEAFRQASPDQQVVVLALRKQRQKGIFDRKFLTSFIAWIDDGELYFDLSRIDWKWEPKSKNQKIPQPEPGVVVMPFEVVPNDIYIRAGRQTLKLDWRGVALRARVPSDEPLAHPDAAGPDGRVAAENATTATEPAVETAGPGDTSSSDPLADLGADDFRALADLEEARQSGAMDEAEYQRRRRQLLKGGN